MGKWFNWPPFVAVAIDADTGKPLDPDIGMRTRREFYNVGKDGKGKKVIVAHKSPSGSQAGNGKKKGELRHHFVRMEVIADYYDWT